MKQNIKSKYKKKQSKFKKSLTLNVCSNNNNVTENINDADKNQSVDRPINYGPPPIKKHCKVETFAHLKNVGPVLKLKPAICIQNVLDDNFPYLNLVTFKNEGALSASCSGLDPNVFNYRKENQETNVLQTSIDSISLTSLVEKETGYDNQDLKMLKNSLNLLDYSLEQDKMNGYLNTGNRDTNLFTLDSEQDEKKNCLLIDSNLSVCSPNLFAYSPEYEETYAHSPIDEDTNNSTSLICNTVQVETNADLHYNNDFNFLTSDPERENTNTLSLKDNNSFIDQTHLTSNLLKTSLTTHFTNLDKPAFKHFSKIGKNVVTLNRKKIIKFYNAFNAIVFNDYGNLVFDKSASCHMYDDAESCYTNDDCNCTVKNLSLDETIEHSENLSVLNMDNVIKPCHEETHSKPNSEYFISDFITHNTLSENNLLDSKTLFDYSDVFCESNCYNYKDDFEHYNDDTEILVEDDDALANFSGNQEVVQRPDLYENDFELFGNYDNKYQKQMCNKTMQDFENISYHCEQKFKEYKNYKYDATRPILFNYFNKINTFDALSIFEKIMKIDLNCGKNFNQDYNIDEDGKNDCGFNYDNILVTCLSDEDPNDSDESFGPIIKSNEECVVVPNDSSLNFDKNDLYYREDSYGYEPKGFKKYTILTSHVDEDVCSLNQVIHIKPPKKFRVWAKLIDYFPKSKLLHQYLQLHCQFCGFMSHLNCCHNHQHKKCSWICQACPYTKAHGYNEYKCPKCYSLLIYKYAFKFLLWDGFDQICVSIYQKDEHLFYGNIQPECTLKLWTERDRLFRRLDGLLHSEVDCSIFSYLNNETVAYYLFDVIID